MNKKKYAVYFTQAVHIEVDLDKFTDEVRAEAEEILYGKESLGEHIGNIAHAARRHDGQPDFIEGYGDPEEIGIVADVYGAEIDEVQEL